MSFHSDKGGSNFFEKGRRKLFGHTPTPPSVFGEGRSQELFQFFQQGFQTPASEDPRLGTFLDRAIREIDKSLGAAQTNFERSLDVGERRGGDAAAFERDLAIAKSEQSSGALTDILGMFEGLRLESATGALKFLLAESGERLGRAQFTLDERLGTMRATEDFFGGRGSEAATTLSGGPAAQMGG